MNTIDITKAKKIQTFDGKPARVIATGLYGEKSVLVTYDDHNDHERAAQVTKTGHMNKKEAFIIPVPEYGWMNIRSKTCRGKTIEEGGVIFDTYNKCVRYSTKNTVRTIRVSR